MARGAGGKRAPQSSGKSKNLKRKFEASSAASADKTAIRKMERFARLRFVHAQRALEKEHERLTSFCLTAPKRMVFLGCVLG
jgi:hypothetical protein